MLESALYTVALQSEKEVRFSDSASLMDYVLSLATLQEASDVHIEPSEHDVLIRFRVGGVLAPFMRIMPWQAGQLLARCKVMMGLDSTEQRRPQDGALRVQVGRELRDIRASFFPSLWGEKVVIRLLGGHQQAMQLYALPFSSQIRLALYTLSRAAQGLFLVTGPTGAGKTTTLYGLLQAVDRSTRNVVTLEDPIEYRIDQVTQTQLNTHTEHSFAQAVRSLLRQDPDVALIGELRDADTAHSAMEAALTGHLVVSSLHTGRASAAPIRLREMGIEPYLIAHALKGILAQRLIATVCESCTEEVPVTQSEAAWAAQQGVVLKTTARGKGCAECRYSGNKGQVVIGELWQCDASALALLHTKEATQIDFEACAQKSGMIPLARVGLQLVIDKKVAIVELMSKDL